MDSRPRDTNNARERIVRQISERSAAVAYANEPVADTCAVCTDDIQRSAPVTVLPCGHLYHTGCFFEWGESGSVAKGIPCPECMGVVALVYCIDPSAGPATGPATCTAVFVGRDAPVATTLGAGYEVWAPRRPRRVPEGSDEYRRRAAAAAGHVQIAQMPAGWRAPADLLSPPDPMPGDVPFTSFPGGRVDYDDDADDAAIAAAIATLERDNDAFSMAREENARMQADIAARVRLAHAHTEQMRIVRRNEEWRSRAYNAAHPNPRVAPSRPPPPPPPLPRRNFQSLGQRQQQQRQQQQQQQQQQRARLQAEYTAHVEHVEHVAARAAAQPMPDPRANPRGLLTTERALAAAHRLGRGLHRMPDAADGTAQMLSVQMPRPRTRRRPPPFVDNSSGDDDDDDDDDDDNDDDGDDDRSAPAHPRYSAWSIRHVVSMIPLIGGLVTHPTSPAGHGARGPARRPARRPTRRPVTQERTAAGFAQSVRTGKRPRKK